MPQDAREDSYKLHRGYFSRFEVYGSVKGFTAMLLYQNHQLLLAGFRLLFQPSEA